MATQQIEFFAPSGLSLTVTLHAEGNDAIAYTASAVVEQTNRKGVYRATFSSIVAGTYQLIALSGAIAVCSYWGFAQDTASTFTFGEVVGNNEDKTGFGLANGSITSSTFANGAITAAAIAADAIGASELAADAVTEIANAVHNFAYGGLAVDGSFQDWIQENLNATVSSRLAAASYTAPLDAAGTRSAVGLATANLDTQLIAIAGYIDTEVSSIKAKTDQLTFTIPGQVDANALTGGGGGSQAIVISPSAALTNQYSKTTDRNPNPLDCPRLAQKTFSISIFQLSPTGEKVPVTMTGRTLRVVFELPSGADLVVIEDAGIGKVDNAVSFTNPVAASTPPIGQKQMTGRWSCREVGTDYPWAWGSWQVFDVAIKD